jgi:hypothetical protein
VKPPVTAASATATTTATTAPVTTKPKLEHGGVVETVPY